MRTSRGAIFERMCVDGLPVYNDNFNDEIGAFGAWIPARRPKKPIPPPTFTKCFPSMTAVKLWRLQRQIFEPTQTLVAYPDGKVEDPARNANKRNTKVSGEAMLISWTSSSHSPNSDPSYATYSSTTPVEQIIFEGDDSGSECSVKSAPAGYSSTVSLEAAVVQCGKNHFSVWQIGDQCLAPFTDYNYYPAYIRAFGPADLCSVCFYDFNHTAFVPVEVLCRRS